MQKNISLGQLLEIIASLGVIAGIGFLALELRQNNELLAAEARYNHKQARTEHVGQLSRVSDLAAVFSKADEGGPLSGPEKVQLDYFYFEMFANWEWEFQEGQIGSLEVPVWAYRRSIAEYPMAAEAWESSKSYYSEAFRDFVDQEVIGGP